MTRPFSGTVLVRLAATLVGPGLLAPAPAPAADAPRADVVVADFEGDSYGGWTVEGAAFGQGPARGALPGQMAVDGFLGKGLVNSFAGGDDSVGTLVSPEFTIERPFVAFLIGGGANPEKLALELLVDGRPVRSATGDNDRPGGAETLEAQGWDVAEFEGRKARLRVVDAATGSWGHLNVDHVVQTDRKPRGMRRLARRELVAEAPYLRFPIRNGAPKRVVTLLVDGREEVRNDVELADGKADWWAPMDVSVWKGKTLSIVVDKLPEESTALEAVHGSESYLEPGIDEPLYSEALRGQFHFSPRRGWNNDPNGLVFHDDEYHLFFQHNPYGWGWGNMHWGHAVSTDLVHWKELGDVLAPDAMGPMFSGSAVVDRKNTSGLGRDGKGPLVLAYTAAGNPAVQCLASSTDGRTFTKFAGNPVVPQFTPGNRDPKILWHEPTQRWVMVLYVEEAGVHTIRFLTSPDLKEWTSESKVDGFFECPDLFELPVAGDPARRKWVLMGASSEYRVGSFDGKTFTPETEKLPGHRGRGFYAAQSFSDVPASDGRRILVGWFQAETRGMPFNQSMSLPLAVSLVDSPQGPRLAWEPVRELESLRRRSHLLGPRELSPGDADPLAGIAAELVEVRAAFVPGDARRVTFRIRGTTVSWEAATEELVVNGHRAPAPLVDGKQSITVYCDRTGVEVFASGGRCYVPMPSVPAADERGVGVVVEGGKAVFERLDVHELGSAWEREEGR